MRKGIIDIGTNSVRLLIADVMDEKLDIIDTQIMTTRLGEGVHKNMVLSTKAMDRTYLAVQKFAEIAKCNKAQTIKCFATSATRDAKNGMEFIQKLRDELMIDARLIGGNKEAELAYKGALLGVSDIINISNITVIDIGGGSTEVISGTDSVIKNSNSIDVGAVRLTDIFGSIEEYDHKKITDINNYINNSLGNINKPSIEFVLVGVAGTITTLAAMQQELAIYEPAKIQGYRMSITTINSWCDRLVRMTTLERKKIAGLNPERADIIPAGVLILRNVMNHLGADYIIISDYGNLHALAMYDV